MTLNKKVEQTFVLIIAADQIIHWNNQEKTGKKMTTAFNQVP